MEILNNFAVFEGLDGSGTSTQLAMLEQKLAGRTLSMEKVAEDVWNEIAKMPIIKSGI
jgi:thymidylate kinase